MKNLKEENENLVLMKIFKGCSEYKLKDNLFMDKMMEIFDDKCIRALIGARDRLVNKNLLTKCFELTGKGRKKCERIRKRRSDGG